MNVPAETRAEYTVLARRYRPQSFGDVVGQEHVAQSLRNAIQSGRVAHAYLFTGARGVGKTSSARILAKSLNCPHAVDGEPCHTCEICQGISTGADVDVLEIDGASNRGIDDIRQLRQNVNVRSMRSRYKVYIIDEVHMLTKEAFNALLKTLEEPPPNVKFVFCTTEPNKVPDTILSRCQRFDFGTIATSNIKLRLQQIAESEGRQVSPEALELVSRRAAGSMRDSQSLFDQLLAYGGNSIDAADVHRLLGTAPDERLIELIGALLEQQPGQALELFQAALDSGVQLTELTDQFLAYFRDLLVASAGARNVPLLSIADANFPQLRTQAERWGLRRILAAMQLLSEMKGKMRGTTYGRSLAEMCLVRLALLEDLGALEQAVAALKSGGTAVASAPARSVSPPGERRPPVPVQPPVNERVSEKKNELTSPDSQISEQAITRTTGTERAVSSATPPPPATPSVPLNSGSEKEFWKTLSDGLTGLLKTATGKGTPKVLSSATSGPILLAIGYPAGYDTAYLIRSLAELEKTATRLAGRQVKLQVTTAAEGTPAPTPASGKGCPPPERPGKAVSGAEDNYGRLISSVRYG